MHLSENKNTLRDPLAANRLETGYKHREDCAKYLFVEKSFQHVSTGVVRSAYLPVLSKLGAASEMVCRVSEYGILEIKNKNTEFEDRYQGNDTRGREGFIFSCDRFSCVRRASVLVGI